MANAAALSKPSRAASTQQENAAGAAATRSLNRDVAGLAIAALTLMLLVSVVTRDPRDPITTPAWPLRLLYTPDVTHYPLNDSLTNACGYWGALVSAMLIDAVGVSIVIVIVAAASVAFAILGQGMVNAPALRSLGGTVVVIAVSTAAGLAPLRLDGFPAVGAGGYLGAMTSTYLQEHFALPGAWILTITVLLIGLMMTTDYALWYAGAKVLSCGTMVSRRGFATVHEVLPLRRKGSRAVVTDLDNPLTVAGQTPSGQSVELSGNRDPRQPHESEPTVKLRKRPKSGSEAAGAGGANEASSTDLDGGDAPDQAGKAKKVQAGLAGLAAAVGLGGKSAGDHDEPDEESLVDEADSDEADDEQLAEPLIRELDVDGQPVTLRSDEPHDEPAAPKIRMPKKRDELQAVMDAVNEDLPEGADEYRLPNLELLDESDDICYDDQTAEVRRKAKILEKTFKNFGFNVKVVEIETGPVIAQYEVELEAGLRLSKITGLADDLAIALRVPSVRIVAPIPGKNTVGIEVPNEHRQLVRLREVIEETNGRRQEDEDPDLPRQRRRRQPAGRRPRDAAAPADRRPHRHGQERVPQLDHRRRC